MSPTELYEMIRDLLVLEGRKTNLGASQIDMRVKIATTPSERNKRVEVDGELRRGTPTIRMSEQHIVQKGVLLSMFPI